jgi:hypothetical protein
MLLTVAILISPYASHTNMVLAAVIGHQGESTVHFTDTHTNKNKHFDSPLVSNFHHSTLTLVSGGSKNNFLQQVSGKKPSLLPAPLPTVSAADPPPASSSSVPLNPLASSASPSNNEWTGVQNRFYGFVS